MRLCIYQTELQKCTVDTSDCHSTKDMTTTMMLPKCNEEHYKGCICTPEDCDRRVPIEKANS